MKIAIQGIEGSFHAEAARKLAGKTDVELVPCDTFQHVFAAVEQGTAEAGVVAVENSLHGSINAVYRLLERHDVWISNETSLAIRQYLIAHRPTTLVTLATNTTHVLSQAPALAQVEIWLDTHLPQAIREETQDTAQSVQYIMSKKDPSYLAVAGKHAADLYGGHVVAGPINDDPHNYTRFVMLRKEPVHNKRANRTSIILKTDHSPGALLRALQVFANHDINLSKLDSHPITGDKRHYAFYIDYDAGLETVASQAALRDLHNHGFGVKILGSYQV